MTLKMAIVCDRCGVVHLADYWEPANNNTRQRNRAYKERTCLEKQGWWQHGFNDFCEKCKGIRCTTKTH